MENCFLILVLWLCLKLFQVKGSSWPGGKVQAATLEPHLSWLGLNFVILESVIQELIHNTFFDFFF